MTASRPVVADRRTVLRAGLAVAGLAALGTSGCTTDEPVALSPDQVALDAAAQGEQALVALLTNGLANASPAQARSAEAAATAHRRHVAELVAAGASEPTTAPTAAPATTPSSPSDPDPDVAGRPTARDAVTAQEDQVDALTRSALGVSPDLAVLLGSVAASDAAHAWQLRTSS